MAYGNMLKFRSVQVKLDFKDVLIVPKRSEVQSRKCVDIERQFYFKTSRTSKTIPVKVVPIVSSNMDTVTGVGSFEVLRDHNFMSCFPKHHNAAWLKSSCLLDDHEHLYSTNNYMLSAGVHERDTNTLIYLIDTLAKKGVFVRFVCLDVANGYLTQLADVCLEIRKRYPNMIITAGNVVTPEGVDQLVRNGANIVKCGIGSSSVCTTRLKTGVGYPQLSTVLECSPVARSMGAYLMSDGGVTQPADIAKAIVAGADFVMLGTMLAGHAESPGQLQVDLRTQQSYKEFRGMASREAVDRYNGGLMSYRTAEGKTVRMPYKGRLEDTLLDISGGLRSACAYTNSFDLTDLDANGQFVMVSQTHNALFKDV
jgi:GMP reductase